MATAKRRQEEVEGVVGENEDGCSDGETSEPGSANGSVAGGSNTPGSTNNNNSSSNNNNNGSGTAETAARRLRRELEQQYGPW